MTRILATPETHERPHHRVYRDKYRTHYGDGPYICYFCEQDLLTLEVVHHLDENPWNNELTNLAAAHTACHNQHHHWDVVMSDYSNQRRSAALREDYARRSEDERKARIAAANQWWRENGHTDETRMKLSEAARNRPKVVCDRCGVTVSANSLTNHQRGKRCEQASR